MEQSELIFVKNDYHTILFQFLSVLFRTQSSLAANLLLAKANAEHIQSIYRAYATLNNMLFCITPSNKINTKS